MQSKGRLKIKMQETVQPGKHKENSNPKDDISHIVILVI